MSNFTVVKAGGWVDGETLTGLQATGIQTRLLKAVNGDDGSDHNGKVKLGGIKAPHITLIVDNEPSAAASLSLAVDCDIAGMTQIKLTDTGNDIPVTLTFTNCLVGDIYEVLLNVVSLEDLYHAIMTWAGGGLTHRFNEGDDQPLYGAGRTKWTGRAVNESGGSSAAEIWWRCERLS